MPSVPLPPLALTLHRQLVLLPLSRCGSCVVKRLRLLPVETVVGRATWYGPGLYGNKTASGEILKKGTLTAAHGQLPLGTRVKVTREDTDESVIVVINDRKPFKEGTVIDLAHGAAQELDLDDDGEAVVSLEVLDQQTTTE